MKICVLPGDGIGPEIIAEAVRVLQALAIGCEMEEGLLGGCAVDATGDPYPPATQALAQQADAVLLGAVGGPQWDNLPRAQRPELWNLYNGRIRRGEHVRVFPLSNWTELDVWHYIEQEELELPAIYFAHEREVFEHDGMLYAVSEYVTPSLRVSSIRSLLTTRALSTLSWAISSSAADVSTRV